MDNILFAENLKYLREESKLKQADMHAVLGFNQSTWNNYERAVSLPKMSDLEKISDHFRILESDLLHTELSYHTNFEEIRSRYFACRTPLDPNNTAGLPIPVAIPGNPVQKFGGRLVRNRYFPGTATDNFARANDEFYGTKAPNIVTVDVQGNDNIVYVPVKAQAGYLLGHADKEYMETLPSFQMPGLNNGTFRMFEVQGVSMAPTLLDKDRVIAQWVPSLDEIRENRIHIIVHKEGVAIKRVLNRIKDRQKVYLKSDTLTYRSEYPVKEIDPTDIIEIWYVRLKISSDLSEPSEIYTRLSDLELNQLEIMKKVGLK